VVYRIGRTHIDLVEQGNETVTTLDACPCRAAGVLERAIVLQRAQSDTGFRVALDVHVIELCGLQAAGIDRRRPRTWGARPGRSGVRAAPDPAVVAAVDDGGTSGLRSERPCVAIGVDTICYICKSVTRIARPKHVCSAPIDDVLGTVAGGPGINRYCIGV